MRHVLLILIYAGTFSKVSELSKEKKIEDAKNIAIKQCDFLHIV
jgi:hypothetical protein